MLKGVPGVAGVPGVEGVAGSIFMSLCPSTLIGIVDPTGAVVCGESRHFVFSCNNGYLFLKLYHSISNLRM